MKKKIIELFSQIKPEFDDFENKELISRGILDSFDIISLCEAFNKEFGITINGSDLIPDNFESLDAMIAMLSRIGVKD